MNDGGVKAVPLGHVQLAHVQKLGQPTHDDGDGELVVTHGERGVVRNGENGILW